jgi:Domain of unknown function (DUF4258)
MDCERVVFSGHAIQRMFQRGIGRDAVLAVITSGEVIAEYADDTPFPSRLLLGFVNGSAVHLVVAHDQKTRTCVVVTVYRPTEERWGKDWKSRRTE